MYIEECREVSRAVRGKVVPGLVPVAGVTGHDFPSTVQVCTSNWEPFIKY